MISSIAVGDSDVLDQEGTRGWASLTAHRAPKMSVLSALLLMQALSIRHRNCPCAGRLQGRVYDFLNVMLMAFRDRVCLPKLSCSSCFIDQDIDSPPSPTKNRGVRAVTNNGFLTTGFQSHWQPLAAGLSTGSFRRYFRTPDYQEVLGKGSLVG